MGNLNFLKLKGKVLYNEKLEVARVDNDGDLAVTCFDCGYKIHIPMKYILKLADEYRKGQNEV